MGPEGWQDGGGQEGPRAEWARGGRGRQEHWVVNQEWVCRQKCLLINALHRPLQGVHMFGHLEVIVGEIGGIRVPEKSNKVVNNSCFGAF